MPFHPEAMMVPMMLAPRIRHRSPPGPRPLGRTPTHAMTREQRATFLEAREQVASEGVPAS